MVFQLIDFTASAENLESLREVAIEIAQEARIADGQAWTTMRFEKLNDQGELIGEGNFNVEPYAPMRVVWAWQNC